MDEIKKSSENHPKPLQWTNIRHFEEENKNAPALERKNLPPPPEGFDPQRPPW